jgi:hypothetical protein
MKTFVAVVAWVLSLAACSSPAPFTSPWEEAWGPNFPQPQPGEGALYLVRDAAPEGTPPINMSIGRRPVGGLSSLTWMRFDLQPRLYDLRAFGTQTGSELIITVDPGQTRFFQIEHKASGSAEILEISPRDGRRLVRQGQHVMEMNEPPRFSPE